MYVLSYSPEVESQNFLLNDFVGTKIALGPRVTGTFKCLFGSMEEIHSFHDWLSSYNGREFKMNIVDKKLQNEVDKLKDEVYQLINEKQISEDVKIEEQFEKDTITSLEL
jgi:hypothetical protein